MRRFNTIITFFAILLTATASAQVTDSIIVSGESIVSTLPDTPKVNPTRVRIVDSLVQNAVTPIKSKGLSWRPVVIPIAMIGYGALATGNNWLKSINEDAQEQFFVNRRNQKETNIDDYTIYAPAVAVFSLNIAGVKGKNNMLDAFFLYAVSNAFANGFTFTTKHFTGIMRPDSSDKYSFPSGHTAAAFVAAEFLRQEYKDVSPWIGIAGYVCATGTGFLRIYNNKHWFNDVIAGAGIGIISTRLSYFLYPKVKNLIIRKADKQTGRQSSMMILPTYTDGMVGLSLMRNF